MGFHSRWLIRGGAVLALISVFFLPILSIAQTLGLRIPPQSMPREVGGGGSGEWRSHNPWAEVKPTVLATILIVPFAATFGTLRQDKVVRRLHAGCCFLAFGYALVESLRWRFDPWRLEWIIPALATVWMAAALVRGVDSEELVRASRLAMPAILLLACLFEWRRLGPYGLISGLPMGLVGTILLGVGELLALRDKPDAAEPTSSSP